MYKVVVGITTYNLEKYIGEALESVLKQKTNFSYRIIVADDSSTDRTLEIINQYKRNNQKTIEVLTTENNMGSLANSNRIFDGIQSEYIIFLDGDDYWIHADSLQKQVDFLDSHKEYMMCGGNTQYLRNGVLKDYVINKKYLNKSYCFKDFLSDNMPFVHTSSILLRNKIFINGLPKCYIDAVNTFENCALRGEDFRRILHLEKGPIFIFDEVFSVYRIHKKGIWQGSSIIKQLIETTITYNFYTKFFSKKYGDYFEKKFQKSYKNMMMHLIVKNDMINKMTLEYDEIKLLAELLIDLALKYQCNENQNNSKYKDKICEKIIRTALAIKELKG